MTTSFKFLRRNSDKKYNPVNAVYIGTAHVWLPDGLVYNSPIKPGTPGLVFKDTEHGVCFWDKTTSWNDENIYRIDRDAVRFL